MTAAGSSYTQNPAARLGRGDRGADDERSGLVHVREARVAAGSVAVPAPRAVRAVPRAPGRVDELGRVDEQQLLVGRGPAREGVDARDLEEAAGPDQVPREQDALGPERMLPPE